MDEKQYFEESVPPAHFDASITLVKEFIELNSKLQRRIVLVTSGGTTVPLESQTVRFLDNFSAGTRGSASAEYFIQKGYSCIFLHRQWSLEPYTRNYSHQVHCFLDFLDYQDGKLVVGTKFESEIGRALDLYRKVYILIGFPRSLAPQDKFHYCIRLFIFVEGHHD